MSKTSSLAIAHTEAPISDQPAAIPGGSICLFFIQAVIISVTHCRVLPFIYSV